MASDHDRRIHVEVVFLSPSTSDSGDGVRYRVVRAALDGSGSPDDVAAAVACPPRLDGGPTRAVQVLHSTSWRYEPGHGVVLTYAAVPDPCPGHATTALTAPSVVCSGDPLRPGPDLLHSHHIAAHAVRHLADLALRDPAIAAAAARPADARLWATMADLARQMPTGTHAQAHTAAGQIAGSADRPAPVPNLQMQ
jgi:hypothetical protein